MVNDGKRGGFRGRGRGRGGKGNQNRPDYFPVKEALQQITRIQGVPNPEYIWDNEEKSVTLCHTDRIVTVKGTGDRNRACLAAADIMLSGLYGEHEIQAGNKKFDETAEKAMDTPKWEAKVAQWQSEEGKQERIKEIEEREGLNDDFKERLIQRVHDPTIHPAYTEGEIEYTTLCGNWHARQRWNKFNWICKQCKLQNKIVNPNKKPKKEEGEEQEPEEPVEESNQKTLKCTVWKMNDKENVLLEIDISGEKETLVSTLRMQLIDNAIEQLLADEHITQEAIDKPQPKPVAPKAPMQNMMQNMQPMMMGGGQMMNMMPMQQGMVPMMTPQMMMMNQIQMMNNLQMMQNQMQMVGQVQATGPARRGGKRSYRGGRGRGKKAKKAEE